MVLSVVTHPPDTKLDRRDRPYPLFPPSGPLGRGSRGRGTQPNPVGLTSVLIDTKDVTANRSGLKATPLTDQVRRLSPSCRVSKNLYAGGTGPVVGPSTLSQPPLSPGSVPSKTDPYVLPTSGLGSYVGVDPHREDDGSHLYLRVPSRRARGRTSGRQNSRNLSLLYGHLSVVVRTYPVFGGRVVPDPSLRCP